MKRVCVIGLGYIGLPTASMLAKNGVTVLGADINASIIETINSGNIHIEEPDLKELVEEAVNSGKLTAYTTPQVADVYIIAVPTPVNKDKTANMNCVESAAKSILPLLKKGDLVILESTSPPETTKNILIPILEQSKLKIGEELFVAYCPEKVLPGKIIKELVENDRIIGGINLKSAEKAKTVYSLFVIGDIHLTDSTTAEMVKLMENTYRDVNIALANELAKISSKLGINVWEVIHYTNLHPRVNFHKPGLGVGGHCISVDPWFIIEKQPDVTNLISQARHINDSMPEFTYNLILEQIKDIKKPKVTILGLTYKPDIDDVRESPAIELAKIIEKNSDIELAMNDMHVKNYKKELLSVDEAVKESDCIVLAVNHKEYKQLNPKDIAKKVRTKIVVDTRNFLNKNEWEENGFKYVLLGDSKNI